MPEEKSARARKKYSGEKITRQKKLQTGKNGRGNERSEADCKAEALATFTLQKSEIGNQKREKRKEKRKKGKERREKKGGKRKEGKERREKKGGKRKEGKERREKKGGKR
ncbi:MAG TPA: hypothetical protein VKP58_13495, partial [Candidatus Acidoferrum sp.]|nr:hypothetical protein [Candidatus Acidoferrum sp.]